MVTVCGVASFTCDDPAIFDGNLTDVSSPSDANPWQRLGAGGLST